MKGGGEKRTLVLLVYSYIPESLPESTDEEKTRPERNERRKEHCEKHRKPTLGVHISSCPSRNFGVSLKGCRRRMIIIERHGIRTGGNEDGRVFVCVFGCANVAGVSDTRTDDSGVVSG